MPPPQVEIHEVAKRFGEGPVVLDGISLSVAPGEFVALVGPSGCGKSTLLRIIAGLSQPTSGDVVVERGPENTPAPPSYVFQDATLLPWLTVAQNVELPLRLAGVAASERTLRRTAALHGVRLVDKAEAFPRELSGGQRMRVSLARALITRPSLLLLDEPFGALDEITREHLNEELLAIRQHERWTAFFVTHSVAEAVFLAGRVVVLAANPGRIHAELAVPLPYPRTADTRLSAEYQTLVARASRLVRAIDPGRP